jgi:hypothetical protein
MNERKDPIEDFSKAFDDAMSMTQVEQVKRKIPTKKEFEALKESETRELQKAYDDDFREMLAARMTMFEEEWFPAIIGGKYRIINKKNPLTQLSDKDAYDAFISVTVEKYDVRNDRCVKVPVYPQWKEQAEVYLGGLTFDPQKPFGRDSNKHGHLQWNMWKGWEVLPDSSKDCSLYLEHIRENVCQGNTAAYEWLLDWMAHIIQKPWEHLDKVPAIRGEQGTGKTAFVEIFQTLLTGYTSSMDTADITNHFNASLMNKVLVYADEALWSGDNATLNKLKKLTGGAKIAIELKGKDKFELNNYMRLIITTNSDWCAPIEKGNRRYVIFTCGKKHIQDRKYFQAIDKQMKDGGYQKLMWILLNERELSQRDWSTTPVFDKEANEENLMETMSSHDPVGKWLKMCIDQEVEATTNIFLHDGKEVKTTVVYKQYEQWVEDVREFRTISMDKFSKNLKKYVLRSRITSGADKGFNGWTISRLSIEKNIGDLFS